MKLARYMISALLLLLVTNCSSITPEQTAFLEKVKGVHKFPIKRNALIKKLDLGTTDSLRSAGGVRGGIMSISERWFHTSGLELVAYDYVHVGREWSISANSIDEIIDSGEMIHIPGIPFLVRQSPPHESFKSVVVTTTRGKVIYRSSDGN